jgi:HPt (histidine-containing phosphotransfer) domain-containing protein
MNDHVAKPIDPRSLFEAVERFYKPGNAAGAPKPSGPPAEAGADGSDGLPSIAGLDTKDGLARVGGRRPLYLKLLRQFVEQQGSVVGQIAEAQIAGDVTRAERLAHTLKGVAGTLGAIDVQTEAGALETLIRERGDAKDVETARQRVAARLTPLVDGLRGMFDRTAPDTAPAHSPAPPAGPAESRQAAVQLISLLSELDPAAADFIETNHAALRPLFDVAAWPEFERLVRDYAFADAQAQLEHALESFPAR